MFRFERGLGPRNRFLGGGVGRGAKPRSECPSRRRRSAPVANTLRDVGGGSVAEALATPEVSRTILVIGGGIAGVSAALEAAEAGYDVIIIEKNPYLGGRVAQLYRYFPKLCPPYCGLEINFRRIKDNPRIRFHTMAEVKTISGGPGNFDVTVRLRPRYVNDRCTACNACVAVCPSERLAAPNGPTKGKILRPSDGREVESAVFIQCAGSRDQNHLGYCSGICCLASLKEATYLRERNPNARAHIFYIDLRTPGTYEFFQKKVLSDEHITIMKGKVAKVTEDPGTRRLVVEAEDILAAGKTRLAVDLVVLASGMVPSLARGAPAGPLALDGDHFVLAAQTGEGIFAAGCARAPVDG